MSGPTNRAKLARERAGLSIGQAARLLNLPRESLTEIEERDLAFADADHDQLASIYQVRIEWLTGETELRDYASIDCIDGADKLTPDDRDTGEAMSCEHASAHAWQALPRAHTPSVMLPGEVIPQRCAKASCGHLDCQAEREAQIASALEIDRKQARLSDDSIRGSEPNGRHLFDESEGEL